MHRRTYSRRDLLRVSIGSLGLSLPAFLSAPRVQAEGGSGYGKARSVILLYCWGGVSHLDTWDPKPGAPANVRGEFKPLRTATPGILLGEHMPLLAQQTERLCILRSMHHRSSAHGKGMYWNLTGHPPANFEQVRNQPPSRRQDWPCLGAVVSKFRRSASGLPRYVQLPYPLVDNRTLQAGENAGWLGSGFDPVIVRPARGKPFGGVSRDLGAMVLKLADGTDVERMRTRSALAARLADAAPAVPSATKSFEYFRQMAVDMLLRQQVRAAFDLERESPVVRDAYGDHICGQSVLLARRLVESGVPAVTVICSAGDLNGGSGDHWDTHADNFNRLKKKLLPPLERASFALLNDLADRGLLDQTLVVWLTEFGRTPKVQSNGGRDHYPFCYSVALAGGGVRGGQVYGRSDRIGAAPLDLPCGPADLHATAFHALGIPLDSELHDPLGRAFPLTDGQVLPVF